MTTAKLIKYDIKSNSLKHENYPNCEEICSVEKGIAFLPETLSLLLQTLFCGKDTETKVASIGQAIMQAVRPRVIVAPTTNRFGGADAQTLWF